MLCWVSKIILGGGAGLNQLFLRLTGARCGCVVNCVVVCCGVVLLCCSDAIVCAYCVHFVLVWSDRLLRSGWCKMAMFWTHGSVLVCIVCDDHCGLTVHVSCDAGLHPFYAMGWPENTAVPRTTFTDTQTTTQ